MFANQCNTHAISKCQSYEGCSLFSCGYSKPLNDHHKDMLIDLEMKNHLFKDGRCDKLQLIIHSHTAVSPPGNGQQLLSGRWELKLEEGDLKCVYTKKVGY